MYYDNGEFVNFQILRIQECGLFIVIIIIWATTWSYNRWKQSTGRNLFWILHLFKSDQRKTTPVRIIKNMYSHLVTPTDLQKKTNQSDLSDFRLHIAISCVAKNKSDISFSFYFLIKIPYGSGMAFGFTDSILISPGSIYTRRAIVGGSCYIYVLTCRSLSLFIRSLFLFICSL